MMLNNTQKLLLTFTIFSFLFSACSSKPESSEDIMQEYAENGRRAIGSPFSGAVLVAKNDSVVLKKSYGYYNRELKTKNSTNDEFPIGSITKQFTSMLVMQMVEEGKLNLKDSISAYLPYLPKEFGEKINIHQLLSCTSGLPHYEGILKLGIDREVFASSTYSPKELAILISKVNLVYKPGEAFNYSSLGYLLLGTLLEEVSGKSFSELLKIKITQPLGMQNTGFGSNDFIKNETAKGNRFIEDETYKMLFKKYGGDLQQTSPRDQSNKYSAGGMHSTIEDLFIWSKAIRSNKILSEKYTRQMVTPVDQGYSYGWFKNWGDLIERNTKVRLITHGGALEGYRSSINLFDDGTTIIFLANVSPIKDKDLIHQLYLSTHRLDDVYALNGYPDRGSLKDFEKEGGLKALDNYFKELSDLCGYEVLPSASSIGHIMYLYYQNGNTKVADSLKQSFLTQYKPTETSINRLAYNFMDNNCKIAVEFFLENTKRYPNSANVWDSLGEGNLKCENYQDAVTNFSKSVEVAKKENHHNLKIFQDHLKIAQEKLNIKNN
ncbi:MAG: CubicO group peptidase (beta-lactamase class C family) [Planctomycetota bacterium]|jgi:CubicO group peptidase (beta-lactamase class C family)